VQNVFLAILMSLLAVVAIVSAHAAEITGDKYSYKVQFEGKIEKGDYEKLSTVAGDIASEMNDNSDFSNLSPVLHLFSPGGDLTEAMKIGRFVRKLHWMTTVPNKSLTPAMQKWEKEIKDGLKNPDQDYMCASACFLIFVAGIERSVGPSPILGIHRPYLSDSDLKSISSKDAMSTAVNTRLVVENYLREMSVPAKYADLMFSVRKDDIQWLNPADINSDLSGFIPELRDWVDARCDNRSDLEKMVARSLEAKLDRIGGQLKMLSPDEDRTWHMLLEKELQRDQCVRKLRVELNKQGNKEVWGR
jgi:hypothetical protein